MKVVDKFQCRKAPFIYDVVNQCFVKSLVICTCLHAAHIKSSVLSLKSCENLMH